MLFFNELICITSRKWRSRLVHWRRKIVMIVMLSFFTPSRFGCNFRLIGRLVEFAKMRLNTKCSWRWCRPWLISSTHQNRLDNFHTNVVCYNIYFLHHMNKHNICFLQNCDLPHSSFHIVIERPSFNVIRLRWNWAPAELMIKTSKTEWHASPNMQLDCRGWYF